MPNLVFALACVALASTQAHKINPIEKTLQMISNLQSVVLSQATDAQKGYSKVAAYCNEKARNINFAIKAENAEVSALKASINSNTAYIDMLSNKIEEVVAGIAEGEEELKAAVALRHKETDNFSNEDKELTAIIDSLKRAISTLSKQEGASLLQESSANSVTGALSALVKASAMSSDDALKLTALVQEQHASKQEGDDADEDDSDKAIDSWQSGHVQEAASLTQHEPKAKVYESRSLSSHPALGGILGTLESLLAEASSRLEQLRNAEDAAVQNYHLRSSSLLDVIAASKKDMLEAKASLPEKQQAKAVAAGDLEETSKDLSGDGTAKEALHHECLSAAQDFQASLLSHNEELKALTLAEKAIQDITGSSMAVRTYPKDDESDASFVQRASDTHHVEAGPEKFNAVRFVSGLAVEIGSRNLAQLASRMSSALQVDANPFAKIMDMVQNMIMQLESEADSDSSMKVYCDKELKRNVDSKEDTRDKDDSLKTHVDQKRSRSVKLRSQIATLGHELSTLTKSQSLAREIRQDEHKAFLKDQAEMEQGLNGIKLALKALKDHYGQDAQSDLLSSGASGGILGLLEVVESDFAKSLAELLVVEETSATYYESTVKPSSELEVAAKQHDEKRKKKEEFSVDKEASELSGDARHLDDKLAAIDQYEKVLHHKCAQHDSYEGRNSRREREIAGLKEALTSLAGETGVTASDIIGWPLASPGGLVHVADTADGAAITGDLEVDTIVPKDNDILRVSHDQVRVNDLNVLGTSILGNVSANRTVDVQNITVANTAAASVVPTLLQMGSTQRLRGARRHRS